MVWELECTSKRECMSVSNVGAMSVSVRVGEGAASVSM